jgi:hypothetical protein
MKTGKKSKKSRARSVSTSLGWLRGRFVGIGVAGLMAAVSLVYVACDDSGDNAIKEPATPEAGAPADGALPDGALPDGALPDGAPADCVMNPKTHIEIINACTDAVKVQKNPTLPLLYPDGGLPPPM